MRTVLFKVKFKRPDEALTQPELAIADGAASLPSMGEISVLTGGTGPFSSEKMSMSPKFSNPAMYRRALTRGEQIDRNKLPY